MKKDSLFDTDDILSESGVRELFECIEVRESDVLVKQGGSGTDLFIVESGQFVVTDDKGGNRILESLGEGDVFGEMAFLGGEERSASVTANTTGTLLKLSRKPFVAFLRKNSIPGTKFLLFLERLIVERLRKADALRHLISGDQDLSEKHELRKLRADIRARNKRPLLSADDPILSEMCQWIYARDGQILFRQGERTTDLFIIRKGKVIVVDDNSGEFVLGNFGANDVVGERSFLDGKPRTTTGKASGSAEILMFSRETLQELLDKNTNMAISLNLGLGSLLARRLSMANKTLRLLTYEELREKAEVSRLLSEMRKSLRIKTLH
ncbi:MAG: cyclic nucleotide-binding domain-containing protein [Candidatus Aegiribacteria sp.]|nr:cyclic nucleotide-binding domain-containing protein [Candidatus Aegiribacteria sp.]